MFTLDASSRKKLSGVNPDLVRVAERAAEISPIPFKVTDGLRTIAQQRENVRKGVSKTMNSRHITGHAIDIVPIVDLNDDGKVTSDEMWHHSQLVKLSPYIKKAFRDCGVPFEWGGDWPGSWDKPHWQLPWKKYPIRTASLEGLDPELMQILMEDPDLEHGRMETPLVTTKGGSLLGGGSALGGGAGIASDAAYKLSEADAHISAGNVIGLIIGLLILLGGGLALYTQWEERGKPAPSFLKRWIT
jgi:peptidoglycan L-alanyl-D-glutamate endopeptidase CwlK